MEHEEVGCTERSFRLLIGRKGWAWVFDDNEEVLDGRHFESKDEAMDWMAERTMGHYVKFVPKV